MVHLLADLDRELEPVFFKLGREDINLDHAEVALLFLEFRFQAGRRRYDMDPDVIVVNVPKSGSLQLASAIVAKPAVPIDRTFSFALDEAWGLGGAIVFMRENGNRMGLKATVLKVGDALVDTGLLSALKPRGRVAGEDDSP